MSYAKKAIKGTALVFSINIAAAFIGYLIRMVLARNLTPSEYGLFFAVFTLIHFLAIFKYLGLGQALVKFIPEFQIHKKYDLIRSAIISTFSLSFLTSLIIAATLFLLSGTLAEYYFKSPIASWLLKFFALIFLLSTFKDILRCSLQGLQKMLPFGLMYFVENLIILSLLLFFFSINLGLVGATISYIIVLVIITLIFLPWLSKLTGLFKYKISFSKSISKKLIKFGIPVMIGGLGSIIILYIDTLILTYFRPLSEVGIYNVVVPTAMLLNFIAVSMSQVIFPMMSELWTRKLNNYLAIGINLIQKYTFALIVPLALIMFSFPSILLRVLFGESYIQGAVTLQILVISMIFLVIGTINLNILSALGKPKISTKIMMEGALINLILNFFLIPYYGIIGAATTSLIAYFLIMILSIIKLSKFIELTAPWFNWIKIFIAGMVFVFIIHLLKRLLNLNLYLEATICILIAGIVYLFLIYVFKAIDKREIKNIIS